MEENAGIYLQLYYNLTFILVEREFIQKCHCITVFIAFSSK